MSTYEKHIGKLKIVDLSEFDNNIENFFESECRKMFFDKSEDEIQELYQDVTQFEYRDNEGPWKNLFIDLWYDYHDEWCKYYVVNGVVYEVIEDNELKNNDICILTDNGDGTFDYIMEFYNGDACLYDCIEYELEKLNINKS